MLPAGADVSVVAQDPPRPVCPPGLFANKGASSASCSSSTTTADVEALALPSGFTESIVFSGLTNPTNIEFAADGRIFVAEKSGIIKVYDNLDDTTPTSFSVLPPNVHNYWDRGLLGLTLDPSLTNPSLPSRPWVYVLYTYDHILGSPTAPPRWGDTCPTPPGPTTDGCVVSGRLSRFTVSGTTISGPETVLIEDWCQQFPSHSQGNLAFGPDGALYVSSGDGASFNVVDYGQLGGTSGTPPPTPQNPCADPAQEGGALRSQDLRTEPAGGGGDLRGCGRAGCPDRLVPDGRAVGRGRRPDRRTGTGQSFGGRHARRCRPDRRIGTTARSTSTERAATCRSRQADFAR